MLNAIAITPIICAATVKISPPFLIFAKRPPKGAESGLDTHGISWQTLKLYHKLSEKSIGNALLLAARTRPKFIGGARANYNEELL